MHAGPAGRASRSRAAYPNDRIDGFDLDGHSVKLARESLSGTGLEDRVSLEVHDAGDLTLSASYYLVTLFEALHDMVVPWGFCVPYASLWPKEAPL